MTEIQRLLEEYIKELARRDMSPATIRNYRNDVELFSRWRSESYGEEMDPAAVVQREIVEYRSYLVAVRGASPATVNRRLASLSSFFGWCASTGRSKANPVAEVKSIRLSVPRPAGAQSMSRHCWRC
jgi:site-specific recombinase XerD